MLINEFKVVNSSSGKGVKKVGHLEKVGSYNKVVFEEDQNLHAIIQSYKDSCSIDTIIARHTLGDDIPLHTKGDGIYISKEVYDAYRRSPESNGEILSETYERLYESFGAKDVIDKKEFAKLISKGEVDKLSSLLAKSKEAKKKEEAHE